MDTRGHSKSSAFACFARVYEKGSKDTRRQKQDWLAKGRLFKCIACIVSGTQTDNQTLLGFDLLFVKFHVEDGWCIFRISENSLMRSLNRRGGFAWDESGLPEGCWTFELWGKFSKAMCYSKLFVCHFTNGNRVSNISWEISLKALIGAYPENTFRFVSI